MRTDGELYGYCPNCGAERQTVVVYDPATGTYTVELRCKSEGVKL